MEDMQYSLGKLTAEVASLGQIIQKQTIDLQNVATKVDHLQNQVYQIEKHNVHSGALFKGALIVAAFVGSVATWLISLIK